MTCALVVGDVMIDVIVRPEGPLVAGADRRAKIVTRPGGSGANQAAWLARFGVEARFVGRVGVAEHAAETESLREAGVEPHLRADESLQTGRLVALIDAEGERSFLTDRGANDALVAGDIPDALLEGADHVHISGYCFVDPRARSAAIDLMERANRRGVPKSIDPPSTEFLREIGPSNFLAWTRGADIAFPNEDEATALTGAADMRDYLARLCANYSLVVVKRGARGAAAAKGAQRWRAVAPSVAAIDTTGAGDAFLAAFLAARLAGAPTEKCLQRANEAGAAATLIVGGRPDRGA
ncbi:MAG TPA: PfkB family carbohydrate kinase [Roseiarcus sp.]|nr:PfkB family carbohydrate kinase [Roseiarcus sp.]